MWLGIYKENSQERIQITSRSFTIGLILFGVVAWKYKQGHTRSAGHENVLVILNVLSGFVDSNMHVIGDGLAFIY